MEDFSNCISHCQLVSLEPTGGLFTWSGVRSQGRTWRRLDRALINLPIIAHFDDITLKHLARFNCDHKPLLVQCIQKDYSGPKPFRFLDCWTFHDSFQTFVKDTWDGFPTTGGMRGMANKLQAMKKALKTWNKLVFGNTHSNLIAAEEAASQSQADFELNPTEQNREAMQQANAKFILATNLEVQYWKQKANIKWMDKGDSNSKLFQAFVKGKRKKLTISHIIGSNGKGYYNLDDIKKEAVSYFTNTFKKTHHPSVDPILPLIPLVLSQEDNSSFSSLPTLEEVKQAVWDLDDTSVGGPDGFNGKFFKTTWDTIKLDVLSASQEFFLGVPIPKAYGSTLLTLIPKTENSKKFDNFRPISLSTFMSKINTKLLANRLSIFLPKLLSPEQAAFQKGKSIDDHVLMAEEAIHLLDKKVFGSNLILKIDMAKAFDRLDWDYLEKILAAFGFNSHSI
ncbi:unnamed protein product, partial [Cuscuta campestris]